MRYHILFISHLGNGVSAGPHWSVPARVKAQTHYDDVLWINVSNVHEQRYDESEVYHTMSEYGEFWLGQLPVPFNHPDMVVFEGFYSIEAVRFAKELRRQHIPYIITPRGSLTRQARHNKSRWKKNIAHLLFFDTFVRRAAAIQFLTVQEQSDSICPNKSQYILPNGFSTPLKAKEYFSEKGIKALFIGRIDIYHKGLDILIEAIRLVQTELRLADFSIAIYGPRNDDAAKLEEQISQYGITDMVEMKGVVSGVEKEQAILDADVFIMTSRFEGHPMGLIEALAYGLPCVVTTGTNMREEIDQSDAGWTCDGTVESVARTLLSMIREKSSFVQKSKNALALAQEYDWDILAKRLHAIFEELV